MKLRLATLSDLDSVLLFYDNVMEKTPGIGSYAQWHKGKHPTSEGIRAYIEEGCMYLYMEEGIAGAVVLTMRQEENYHSIAWSVPAKDDEVAVIHLLAVSPECQGSGIGAEIVRESILLAKQNGKKAVRLDATASNTPVHRLYERLGFICRGKRKMYAENNGFIDFLFFEYSVV